MADPDPSPHATGTITSLLRKAGSGDAAARDELFRSVYDELRALARQLMRSGNWPESGLEATGLVNAACERLLGRDRLTAEDRRHFFFLFGRAMHDVLVEQARADLADKRGGNHKRIPLIEFEVDQSRSRSGLLDLHAAMEELRARDPEAAQVIELRFFGSRTLEQTAEVMNTSVASVRRNWDYARAWLAERLSASGIPAAPAQTPAATNQSGNS